MADAVVNPQPFARSRRPGWFIGRSDVGDYMHRWLVETPWFALRLHHILRSDETRALHDHPWSFVSLILRGGYTEVTASGVRWYGPGAVRRVPATQLHRLVLDAPAWTLVLAGPKWREWGFQVPERGWVNWKEARDMWAGFEVSK